MSSNDNIIMFDDVRRKARSSRAPSSSSRISNPNVNKARSSQASSVRYSRSITQSAIRSHTTASRTNATSGFSSRVYEDIFAGINHDIDYDMREAYQEDEAMCASKSRSAVTSSEPRSKSEQKKRDKASNRAARQFMNQFGSLQSSSSEGGTRAAVYKGEMGKQHKRAVLQADTGHDGGETSCAQHAHNYCYSLIKKVLIGVACAMVVLVGVGIFLYPAAQQYYIEMRNHDRLELEYEAVVDRNEAIQQDVDHLSTDEGIQDAARTDLGWVQEGENAVIIQGLPEGTDSGSGTEVHAQVPSSSIEAPETWYSGFLDSFFGYSSSTQAKV